MFGRASHHACTVRSITVAALDLTTQSWTDNTTSSPILHCEPHKRPHGKICVYNAGPTQDCSPSTYTRYANRRLTTEPGASVPTQRSHRTAMDTENQVLNEIQRLRGELDEAIRDLRAEEADRKSFRGQLRDSRTELTTVYEKLAAILVKQEQCGCGCCTDGARMYADLQVSHHPTSDAPPSTDPREGGA